MCSQIFPHRVFVCGILRVALHLICISGTNSCFFKLIQKKDFNYYLHLFSGAAIALVSCSWVSANSLMVCNMFGIDIIQQNLRVQGQGVIGEANTSVVADNVHAGS